MSKQTLETELNRKERCVCFLCGGVAYRTMPHKPGGLWFCDSCDIDDEDYLFAIEHGHLPGDPDGLKSAYALNETVNCCMREDDAA